MSESSRVRFPKGDAAATRLVKKLSEERGLEVEVHERWNGYGYTVTGYTADSGVVEEATGIVAERRHAARRKEEARSRRLEEGRRLAWLEKVNRLYPLLERVPPHGTALYDGWAATPLHLYSRTQWRRIGYEVRPDAESMSYCCLHRGRLVVPLYRPAQVDERRSRHGHLSGEALWDRYKAMGLGLAHAVWAANKLQKIKPHDKARFYRLKDRFLERHQDALVEGRVARHEARLCWDCDGGEHPYGETCWKCGGTGVYSERTLYEHILDLDGRAWSFHSYIEPRSVGETPGADLAAYGKRFGPKDRVPLRLPVYITMLAHILEEQP
jgi:hypothetical protein